MSVVAFLVLGSDGSSSASGTSAGVTTSADRSVFLAARRACDAILIGGRSAASEPYARTPVPLIVVSTTRPDILNKNPKAIWWNCSPSDAIQRATSEFGSRICVEGGVNFLNELLKHGKIAELRLSITPYSGGDNPIDIAALLAHFGRISKSRTDETQFYICTEPVLPFSSPALLID
ncbi:MAG: dihydrofolate reductase family protein [Actinobacteria bacterium]|nr:dihydrofolate reductase family protein [Actinomycetota bacterium]